MASIHYLPDDLIPIGDRVPDTGNIHDICCVVAYFNVVNRIAGGLGVEVEPRSGR